VKKAINTLRPGKDDLGLTTRGMYFIPCECGKVYVCQTSRAIETRCQEHIKHLWHGQSEKSAVTKNIQNRRHEIPF